MGISLVYHPLTYLASQQHLAAYPLLTLPSEDFSLSQLQGSGRHRVEALSSDNRCRSVGGHRRIVTQEYNRPSSPCGTMTMAMTHRSPQDPRSVEVEGSRHLPSSLSLCGSANGH